MASAKICTKNPIGETAESLEQVQKEQNTQNSSDFGRFFILAWAMVVNVLGTFPIIYIFWHPILNTT